MVGSGFEFMFGAAIGVLTAGVPFLEAEMFETSNYHSVGYEGHFSSFCYFLLRSSFHLLLLPYMTRHMPYVIFSTIRRQHSECIDSVLVLENLLLGDVKAVAWCRNINLNCTNAKQSTLSKLSTISGKTVQAVVVKQLYYR
jgi:hypothetical protein